MLLLWVFIAVVLINAAYFLLFSKFTFAQPETLEKKGSFPVSIIVCAKNEAENLRKNVPHWLAQDYPNFELILINDASTDDTLEIIESFAQNDARVHTVNIENNEAFWSNKKYSLTLGIKRAVNKRMLFTDADCRPASNDWLSLMTSELSNETELILGYGAHEKKKGILNRLIRFETLMTAIQYFSYAKAGMPYMGVGRNMAYTSKLFYDNRGFMSHMDIPSGDDDLFVNESAYKDNTSISFHPNAFTYSVPKSSFGKWFTQKRRHVSTAKHYKPKHRFLLASYYITNLLFWVLAGLCFAFADWKMTLGIFIFRIALQYIFIGNGAKNLKEKDLTPFIPLLELFLVLFQLTIFITNSISKPKRWK
ncbi:glycosyltransferase [Aureisphaera galaxeae]|uniref:glycosyltransferase n=1 Tax=Aureisphaera galaxeae TaxID=1538023 RepID=UPI00234FF3E9|nr:glycosyltransferase [Aureisphaera galaxeae]MDC8006105.1 glycosyltransferase [Aureisphaera galaxeae]